MAQKTDLNVAPYYDDFDVNDNFHRILFRPGFAVQARELTQLQSILQNQIERHGQNVFEEGTVIIPGQISISNAYTSIQLASQFGGEDVVPSQYLNSTTPVTITGATSGVKARVIGFEDGTSTTQPRLYVQYIEAGSDNTTQVFANSENITADARVGFTITETLVTPETDSSLTDNATGSSNFAA